MSKEKGLDYAGSIKIPTSADRPAVRVEERYEINQAIRKTEPLTNVVDGKGRIARPIDLPRHVTCSEQYAQRCASMVVML